MAAGWLAQFGATLHRNFLVKLRDGSQTLQEIFLPVYIIVLLIIIKLVQPEVHQLAVPLQPEVNAACLSVVVGDPSSCWSFPDRSPAENLLVFAPGSNGALEDLVVKAVEEINEQYSSSFPRLTAYGLPAEREIVDFYNDNPGVVFAAVVFDGTPEGSQELPADLIYRIRINGTDMPSMSKSVSSKEECRPPKYGQSLLSECEAHQYLTSGFLAIQTSIAHAATVKATPPGSPCNPSSGYRRATHAAQIPLPPYHRAFSSTQFQLFAAMYLVWALAPVLQVTLTHLVREKQMLLKDCMLVMGLRESVYWISWLVTYAVMAAVTSLVIVVTAKFSTLFSHSSMLAIFVIIYPYSLSLIALAFALSAMLTTVRSASTLAAALPLLGSLAIVPIQLLHWPSAVCGLLSLFSPVGFAMAIDIVAAAEGTGAGVQLATFWSTRVGVDPGDPSNPLSLGLIVCLCVLDMLLYAVAAWYLDNAWPHPERGPKKAWNFVLQKSYWFPSTTLPYTSLAPHIGQQELDDNSLMLETLGDHDSLGSGNNSDSPEENDPNIEPVGPQLERRAAIKILHVTKDYPNRWSTGWKFWASKGLPQRSGRGEGEVVAVKDLSLTLYEGQTFAFLGHSGSGKSAIMSMLSGLSRPSSGGITIYGHDVSESGPMLQALLGVCPANDISLDCLTPREQLRYFAAIKATVGQHAFVSFSQENGTEERQAGPPNPRQLVDEMLAEMGLAEDADRPTYELSPTQQRKLSLAIALVGNPKVVLLDEPTKGLDPQSRKQVWDALTKQSKGRVVVFTTHSMDEADAVAERKAIVSHGRLKCCGSSLFLRNRFGLSYLLHVTKAEAFNGPAVLALIQSRLPEAALLPALRGQAHVTYRLPLGQLAQTKDLLMELTGRAEELGVEEGALEAMTLEEVFQKFQDEAEEEAGSLGDQSKGVSSEYFSSHLLGDEDKEEGEVLISTGEDRTTTRTSPNYRKRWSTVGKQFTAFFVSRLLLYRRNLGSTFATFGPPLLFAFIVLVIQASTHPSPPHARTLVDPAIANDVPIFYSIANSQQVAPLRAMFDKLGPNHAFLAEAQLKDRFEADPANNEMNGKGVNAVGVKFDSFDMDACQAEYTILYHPWHIHQLPSVAAMLDNLIHQAIRSQVGPTAGGPSEVHVVSQPLPPADLSYLLGYFVAVVVAVAMLMVPPSLAQQVVADKEFGYRTLFHVAGLRGAVFWAATMAADFILFFATGGLILLLGLAFGQTPFLLAAAPAVLLLFAVALPALILLSYLLSFAFRSASSAGSAISMLVLLGGALPYTLVMVALNPSTQGIPHFVLSCLDPPYALIAGLHLIAGADIQRRLVDYASPEPPPPEGYLLWSPGANLPVTIIGLVAFTLAAIVRLWVLERREFDPQARGQGDLLVFAGGEGQREEEEDLLEEKARVQANAAKWDVVDGEEADLVLCSTMGKNFGAATGLCGLVEEPGTWALTNFWLGVARGEVVVLLGGENAGKSTVLQCLAGAVPLSYGDALVNGSSVRYSYEHDPSGFGYLPQGEVLYGALTVREHLALFAAVKAVAEPRSMAVDGALATMKLADVANVVVGKCKAAVLRRLSLAITLLGSPPVLLLDEPSQGLDVASRRELWVRLLREAKHRATLVCTHSVEEAEALGARVGILVGGELKCLGSPQQLKQRFGSTYTLLLSSSPERLPAIREFITTLFPTPPQEDDEFTATSLPSFRQWQQSGSRPPTNGEEGEEEDAGMGLSGQAKFRVPVEGLRELAMLLHELEARRDMLGIEDYSVSQPTLQQVFHRLSHDRGQR